MNNSQMENTKRVDVASTLGALNCNLKGDLLVGRGVME